MKKLLKIPWKSIRRTNYENNTKRKKSGSISILLIVIFLALFDQVRGQTICNLQNVINRTNCDFTVEAICIDLVKCDYYNGGWSNGSTVITCPASNSRSIGSSGITPNCAANIVLYKICGTTGSCNTCTYFTCTPFIGDLTTCQSLYNLFAPHNSLFGIGCTDCCEPGYQVYASYNDATGEITLECLSP